MDVPWIVWLLLAIVILVVIAVIVLFVTKAWKSSQSNNNPGPQGAQGIHGQQGHQGSVGSQGVSGGTGVLLTQVPVTLLLKSFANINFPNNQGTMNTTGVLTVIGNMLTLDFSQVPVVVVNGLTSDFIFDVVLPSGFDFADVNPLKVFVGICETDRQINVNSTPIYLRLASLVSSNAAIRLTCQCQEGLIWSGAGTQPTLLCSFRIVLLLLAS